MGFLAVLLIAVAALGQPALANVVAPEVGCCSFAPRTGGTTLVAGDAVSIRVADRVPVASGHHNVVLHGDANGFVGASVDDVAAAVRADPAYGGQPICLLSCNSASNGSAQALATQLDVPMQASTGLVGGPRPPAVPEVVLGPGSEWLWFYPGGA